MKNLNFKKIRILKNLYPDPMTDNPYFKLRKIPIGTKQPFMSYGKIIPESEIVFIYLPRPGSSLGILLLAPQGYHKTVIVKRISYYLHKSGWNLAIFDPKGREIRYGAYFTTEERLLPKEKGDTLPIVPFIHAFSLAEVHPMYVANYKKQFQVFSTHLKDINRSEMLQTIKIPAAGAEHLLNIFKDNPNLTMEMLSEVLEGRIEIPSSTKKALDRKVKYFINSKLFDDKFPSVDLIKIWNEKKIPSFSLFEMGDTAAGFICGLIIIFAYRKYFTENKFIIIDDAQKLLGRKMDAAEHLSTRAIVDNIFAIGREQNWHGMVCSQDPSLINQEVIRRMNYKIIGKISNLEPFKTWDRSVLRTIANLNYDDRNHNYEYALIDPNNKIVSTFYPLGPIIGHTWDNQYLKYQLNK